MNTREVQLRLVFSSLCSDSAEDVRKVCPSCPLLAPLNDTKVVHAVDAALAAFNARNNGSYFQLVEVSRAQLVVRRRPLDRLGNLLAPRECTRWGTEKGHEQQWEGREGRGRKGKERVLGGRRTLRVMRTPRTLSASHKLSHFSLKQPDAAWPQFLSSSQHHGSLFSGWEFPHYPEALSVNSWFSTSLSSITTDHLQHSCSWYL